MSIQNVALLNHEKEEEEEEEGEEKKKEEGAKKMVLWFTFFYGKWPSWFVQGISRNIIRTGTEEGISKESPKNPNERPMTSKTTETQDGPNNLHEPDESNN